MNGELKIAIILFSILFTMIIFIILLTFIKAFLFLYEEPLEVIESFMDWLSDEWSDVKEKIMDITHIGKEDKRK